MMIAKIVSTTALAALPVATFAIEPRISIADCASDEEVAVRAAGYRAKASIGGYDGELPLADAYCAQAKYAAHIGDGHIDIRI